MALYISLPMVIIVLFLFSFSLEYDNLALYQKTWQSSEKFSYKWLAKAAVDGDTNSSISSNSCAVSGSTNRRVTWRVDLGGIKRIASIRIYYRYESEEKYERTYRGRFGGFKVYVSKTIRTDDGLLCNLHHQSKKMPLPPVKEIECISQGQFVIYVNERRKDITYPHYYETKFANFELCEVQVLGCNLPGMFGENCTLDCPRNCEHETCHIKSGKCIRCKDGYIGEKCEQQNSNKNINLSIVSLSAVFGLSATINIITLIVCLFRRCVKQRGRTEVAAYANTTPSKSKHASKQSITQKNIKGNLGKEEEYVELETLPIATRR